MKSLEDFLKEHGNIQLNYNSTSKPKEQNALKVKEDVVIEETNNLAKLDKLKTKVLKYVLYKKRTEKEVRQKFATCENENLLEDVIQNLKDNGYINDNNYIQRAVNEFMAINTLSMKEIRNKLYAKGLSSNLIDDYFSSHQEELENYELACAKKIILKKQTQLDKDEIERFLYKKGYVSSNVKLAFEEL